MNKSYAKWGLAVALIIIVIYTWISYFNIDKFKWTSKDLSDFNSLELGKDVVWSKIEQRTKPKDEEVGEKWIVVTSVALPTEQVKNLSKIKGWKLIVVADTKTPTNWE